MIKTRNTLTQIIPYKPGKSVSQAIQEKGLTSAIKLSSNENPLGSALKPDDLRDAIETVSVYPDIANAPLLDRLAACLNVSRSQLLLGNGSDEVITHLALAYLNPGDSILTSEHTFSEYAFAAYLLDGTVKTIPMQGYRYDLTAMLAAVQSDTRLIFIANPNNPTGTYLSQSELTRFVDAVPSQVLVVLDEAYVEYADAEDFPDALAMLERFDNLVLLRTFSKVYGLASLRIGYGIAGNDIVASLQKVQQPFNINGIALKAAELALQRRDHIDASVRMNAAGKMQLTDGLRDLGFTVLPSQANFVAVDVGRDANGFADTLLGQGIIVRSLFGFDMPTWLRITIGTEAQNQAVIAAFRVVAAQV